MPVPQGMWCQGQTDEGRQCLSLSGSKGRGVSVRIIDNLNEENWTIGTKIQQNCTSPHLYNILCKAGFLAPLIIRRIIMANKIITPF